MARVTFIGDELSAAGFRLAGARILTPEKPAVKEAFANALDDCELILITAEYADELPSELVQQAQRANSPLLLLLPDLRRLFEPPDLAQRIDRALGIES